VLKLIDTTAQLTQALHDLQETQYSLVQKEKMSVLGNLVTAIAHEIKAQN
jgi:C4-dicarboxylate-specific signal transduction histidine kinase